MSLGYAEKLSYIEDVGSVGMAEFFDPPSLFHEKIERLAAMIQKSKHLVVFTGAGISTSCGIPDFRGPKGIWTLQREGKPLPEASLPFHRATPSMTHMALVELEKAGILKFVISQNIDGLHLRSGIPRDKLAELHGNSFMELCPSCGNEYMRDFEIETIGLKETSRRCSKPDCGAKLKDTVLDWEDALPPKEMNPAEKNCKIADLVLCLGTSLQITPACNLPLKSLRGGGKIVIVNLQKTPKDKKATLVIHGLVDKEGEANNYTTSFLEYKKTPVESRVTAVLGGLREEGLRMMEIRRREIDGGSREAFDGGTALAIGFTAIDGSNLDAMTRETGRTHSGCVLRELHEGGVNLNLGFELPGGGLCTQTSSFG